MEVERYFHLDINVKYLVMIFTGSLHMLDEVMYFVPSLKVDIFLGYCRPNDKAIKEEGFKVTHNPNNINFKECLVVTADVIPELNQTTILEINKDFYDKTIFEDIP